MHRQIMGVTNEKCDVDHKDRNGLNNQRSNLRICSRSNNSKNRTSRKNSSSKYLGVHFHKQKGKNSKWVAQIFVDGAPIYLGRFTIEADAARCYDVAALKYHGEFANLNFKTNAI